MTNAGPVSISYALVIRLLAQRIMSFYEFARYEQLPRTANSFVKWEQRRSMQNMNPLVVALQIRSMILSFRHTHRMTREVAEAPTFQ